MRFLLVEDDKECRDLIKLILQNKDVEIFEAWGFADGRSDIIIGIVDSGVDYRFRLPTDHLNYFYPYNERNRKNFFDRFFLFLYHLLTLCAFLITLP